MDDSVQEWDIVMVYYVFKNVMDSIVIMGATCFG